MKRELNPAIAVVLIAVVIGIIIGAFYYLSTPRPPKGVKYTPGVPPWMEQGGTYKPTPDYPPATSTNR